MQARANELKQLPVCRGRGAGEVRRSSAERDGERPFTLEFRTEHGARRGNAHSASPISRSEETLNGGCYGDVTPRRARARFREEHAEFCLIFLINLIDYADDVSDSGL